MKINELVNRFKTDDSNDYLFQFVLGQIAGYTMYEQAIIKKDNNPDGSIIKYRYDENSYQYINEFFSKIEFLSKPVIGSGKKVVIKDLPDEYKYPSKHEVPFEDKIYILDKIKDSFMHLRGEDTMYDFDFNNRCILIKNVAGDYSLECKIPFDDLFKFNQKVKIDYDKSTPSLDWVDQFLFGKNPYKNIKKVLTNNSNDNVYEIRVSNRQRVIFNPDSKNIFSFYEKTFDGTKGTSLKEVVNYHVDSYVTLLLASSKNMNYPLLGKLYDFDFHCTNQNYKDKVNSMMKGMVDLYLSFYDKVGFMDPDRLKTDLLKCFLYFDQKENEQGFIADMSFINNLIIHFMRNARSHANNKGTDNAPFKEENILYYDVSYNSLLNPISSKTEPTFALEGKRRDFDIFFEELRSRSMSNGEFFIQIKNEFFNDKYDTLELFLEELDQFIVHCALEGNKDAEILTFSKGNALDFTDFIRKIIKGTFVKGEEEDNKKKK